TATASGKPMKVLAAELDWAPSELSMRTTLSGDSARAFPADDEHLVKLMRLTGDPSILFTLADLLGFERPVPKREQLAAAAVGIQEDIRRIGSRVEQLVLELDGRGKKR